MKITESRELYQKAVKLFPGGVNSPVRAFKSVGGDPLFIEKGKGCHIWDADGNRYIDFNGSWGPLILGHANEKVRHEVAKTIENGLSFGAPTRQENELAELILDNNRYIDKIRFVSSGTEAVMSAIRLARGYTGRNKVIKFEGCYHGHVDALLVEAGSGLATFGTSTSAGIPESFIRETVVLPLNDKGAVEAAFEKYSDDIACVILEPIPANNGLLVQEREYLEFLREICSEHGSVLLFDEVISGFRVGFEGAAAHYDIQPDIITYGKIIGGGMPVGAFAGSNEIMGKISPDGDVYQAGTLSGNPVAMAAGKAQLEQCLSEGFYRDLEEKTQKFTAGIQDYADSKGYALKIFSKASIFWMAFTDKEKIQAAAEIDGSTMEQFKTLYKALLERGVYLGPSGYEVGFISAAHDEQALSEATEAFCESLDIAFG